MTQETRSSDLRPTNTRWLIFFLACGTSWFLYLHRYAWNLISPELEKEFGFNNTQLAGLYALFNTTYGIGQIPSGVLSDLFGPHFLLGMMILLWSAVLPCFGLSGNYKFLGAVELAFGAAQSGAYPNLTRVTKSWFPLQSRTIIQGWVATFFGRGGGAMSPIIMGTLLMGGLGLSWRMAILIMGIAGLIFGICFLLLFRNSPERDSRVNEAECELISAGETKSGDTSRVLPVSRAIKNRSMQFFVFQQFLNAGADTVFLTFMGTYFLNAKGFDITEAGIMVSLPLWGGAIGGMLGGYCNDWLIRLTGNRRWSRSSVGAVGKIVACILMFVAISQDNGYAAGVALFAVKFFSDWSQPTVWGTCTDLGGKYSATVFSIINTSGTIGGIIFPPIFGMILDFNKDQATGITNYNPMFITVAIMYVGSALSWLVIDCTKSLDRDEPFPSPSLNS